jgi:thiamine-monophosphate kinase
MGEFELIRRFFLPLARRGRDTTLVMGPGDDCAVQRLAPGTDLVFSVDTLVEGVHFPEHYPPEYLGWRALAVAVSDLAAMGAEPHCYTLALTLPVATEDWLEGFASGLARASEAFGIALAGGDTTRGPLTITLQVHGSVPTGAAISRGGARAGDLVCVSGTLGDAGEALNWLAADDPGPQARAVLESYRHPRPRLSLGQSLRGQASAAVDISDGLLADLTHILEASGVGARLDAGTLPLSDALLALRGREKAVELGLTAGDDYQLCVTIDPDRFGVLAEDVRRQLTVVGNVEADPGIRLTGAPAGLDTGYDHFREYS